MTLWAQVQTIDVSSGAEEELWPVTVTELSGLDTSQEPVVVSLGDVYKAGDWKSPDSIVRGTISQADYLLANPDAKITAPPGAPLYYVTVSTSIDTASGYALQSYYYWIQIGTPPTVIVRRTSRFILS